MRTITYLACIMLAINCNNHQPEQKIALKDSTPAADSTKEPVISIEETTMKSMHLLVIKDTAQSTALIGPKLGADYGKIGKCMKACNAQMAGAPMASYNQQQAPFIFEAAVPFNIICPNPTGGVYNKEIKAGKAVVAHFFGPYELTVKGHAAIQAWLKKNHKTATGSSWEVYVTDPTTVKDPYLVQTDIYYTIQ